MNEAETFWERWQLEVYGNIVESDELVEDDAAPRNGETTEQFLIRQENFFNTQFE